MGTKAESKRKCSAAQAVYQELKRQILRFQLLPGSALDEHQILRKLGFSRTPFREACMRLLEEGWLLAFSRRGFLIAPITLDDIVNTYELRLIVESASAQLAAARATDDEIGRLEKMCQALEERSQIKGTDEDVVRMNHEFHLYLAELSRNKRLINIVHNILEHVTRFDSMISRYAPATSLVQHRRVVQAIKDRDPVKAGASMQEHIEQSRLQIVNAYAAQSPRRSFSPLHDNAAAGFSGRCGHSCCLRGECQAAPTA